MTTVVIKPPSDQQPPRVDKYASESIVYNLDCTAILGKNEIIVEVLNMPSAENISASDIRARKGTHIQVRIDNSPVMQSNYVDYRLAVLFITNLGNRKAANFTVRVYK